MSEINNISNNMKLPTINNNSKSSTTTNKENSIKQLNNQIEEINLDANNLEITKDSHVEKLSEYEYSKSFGLDLLKGANIHKYKREDIESVNQLSENGDIYVELKSGITIAFDPTNYDLVKVCILGEWLDYYKIESQEETEKIRDDFWLNDTEYPLSYFTIRDTNIKICQGDLSFNKFLENVEGIMKSINSYPKNVREFIYNINDFKGFYITDNMKDSWRHGEGYISDSTAAFTWSDFFIFMKPPEGFFESDTEEVIVHEIGHLIDYALVGDESYYSNNTVLNLLWITYGLKLASIQPITSGYSSLIPNAQEFFACAVESYIHRPFELATKIPALYIYIDAIIKSI